MYIFVSEDKNIALERAKSLRDTLLQKNPDALSMTYSEDNFGDDILAELWQSQALFKNNYLVFLNNVLSSSNEREDYLEKMTSSENLFIAAESALSNDFLQEASKLGATVKKYVGKNIAKDDASVSAFRFTDAILSQDIKTAWILYLDLLKTNEVEKIYGSIWWALKNLLQVAHSNKNNIKMKAFVYDKNKKFLKNIDIDRFKSSVKEFVFLDEFAYSRGLDMKDALERWILSLNFKK